MSEAGLESGPVPAWVRSAIQVGFRWPRGVGGPRRIALLSTPCDSAIAGLICLGALVADLGDPASNDLDAHYDGLLRYAHQYLTACAHCSMRCEPKHARCGFEAEASGWLRHASKKRFRIHKATDIPGRKLVMSIPTGFWWQDPKRAADWGIDAEPPALVPTGADSGLHRERGIYTALVEGAFIHEAHLNASYSGLCFAGRVTGATAAKSVCEGLSFGVDPSKSLAELLTIASWSPAGRVSRTALFNTRTLAFDRRDCEPRLVVVDGDEAFLRVLEHKAFRRSDVIGVFHRVIDRERLEALGNKLASLRQWYQIDDEQNARLGRMPQGVSLTALRRSV